MTAPVDAKAIAMTDEQRAKLLELADRVEKATGADRELDGLVFAHMNPDKRVIIGQKPGRFPQDPIYGGPLDIIWIDGFADVLGAPRYTASLDAAMSLVPSGMLWSVEWAGHQTRDRIASCTIWKPHMPTSIAVAATPALALTAASLRAIAGSLPD